MGVKREHDSQTRAQRLNQKVIFFQTHAALRGMHFALSFSPQ